MEDYIQLHMIVETKIVHKTETKPCSTHNLRNHQKNVNQQRNDTRKVHYIGNTSDLFAGMLALPLVAGGSAPAGACEMGVDVPPAGYGFSDDGGRDKG